MDPAELKEILDQMARVATPQWESGGSITHFRFFPEIEKACFVLPDHIVQGKEPQKEFR